MLRSRCLLPGGSSTFTAHAHSSISSTYLRLPVSGATSRIAAPQRFAFAREHSASLAVMSIPPKPIWIAIIASLVVVAVVVVVIVAPAKPPDDRPSVRYVTVDAHVAAAHAGGHELSVSIELETTSRMPHVAPHIKAAARCGSAVDEGQAFFMDLSRAMPGDRKVDTVELFRVDSFDTPPDRCELTLSLTDGATLPQRYCFQGVAPRRARASDSNVGVERALTHRRSEADRARVRPLPPR